MDMNWLWRMFQPGGYGAAPSIQSQPLAAPASGMMAGVPGFDPSDPGAYANRSTGDQDLRGYGGSPPLADEPRRNWGGQISAGLSLLQEAGSTPTYQQLPAMAPTPMPQPAMAPPPTSTFHAPQGAGQGGGLLSVNPFADPQPQAPRRRKFQGLLG